MKRKIALLIAAILAAGTVWVSAVAAAGPLLTASDESAKVGDTVVVTVSISQNPGINWNSFYVKYDSSKLQLVSAQNGEVMNSWDSYSISEANGSYLVTTHTSTTKNTSKDGTMAVLTFKVLDNAAGSECIVSLSSKECYTDTGTSIEKVGVSTANGSITVSKSSSSSSSSSDQTGGNDGQSDSDISSGNDISGDNHGNSGSEQGTSEDSSSSSSGTSSSGSGGIHSGSGTGTSSGTGGQPEDSDSENIEQSTDSYGWVQSGKIWYYQADGKYVTGWKKIDNVWYYFDSKGIMKTGWQKVDGIWYYLKSWGGMATGWQKIDGVWYYLTGSGAMKTGWLQTGGKWYYLSGSGAMKTGWVKWNNNWYYMDSSGAMLTNTTTPDGYYVDKDGIWKN